MDSLFFDGGEMEKELLKERMDTIYGFICDELYVPMKAKEIAIVLNIPKQHSRRRERLRYRQRANIKRQRASF